jgi:hypothetical protein
MSIDYLFTPVPERSLYNLEGFKAAYLVHKDEHQPSGSMKVLGWLEYGMAGDTPIAAVHLRLPFRQDIGLLYSDGNPCHWSLFFENNKLPDRPLEHLRNFQGFTGVNSVDGLMQLLSQQTANLNYIKPGDIDKIKEDLYDIQSALKQKGLPTQPNSPDNLSNEYANRFYRDFLALK